MYTTQFAAHANGVDIVATSEIPILPIVWLWQNWLAAGKLHILAGPPGTGKTMLALAFAATLSNGGTAQVRWPDGRPAPFGRVLIWSGEDDIADTIVPRLVAAGANRQHVLTLRGMHEGGRPRAFNFTRDMARLREEIAAIGNIKLLIIDSIVQAVAGDSNRNSEVRRNLEPLTDMAAQYGFAILGLTHVSKGSGAKDPVDRVTGSLAFAAVARIVMLTGKSEADQSDDGTSHGVLVRAKSNLGPSDGGFEYQINPVSVPARSGFAYSSAIAWNPTALRGAARDILRAAAGQAPEPKVGKLEIAIAFVRDHLASGPRSCAEMEAQAKEAGISPATLRRARETLGVETQKSTGQNGVISSIWSLAFRPGEAWGSHAHERAFVAPHTFSQSPFSLPVYPQSPNSNQDASAMVTPVAAFAGSASPDRGFWGNPAATPAGNEPHFANQPIGLFAPQPLSDRGEQVEQVERVAQVERVEPVEEWLRLLGTPTFDFHADIAQKAYRTLSRKHGESESTFVDRVIADALAGSVNETEDDRRLIEELRWLLKHHCHFC